MNRLRTTLGISLVAFSVAIGACGTGSSSRVLTRVPPLAGSAQGTGTAQGTGSGPAAGGTMALAVPVRVDYQIQGALPSLANHAEAYRLDATTTPARVGQLAAAFGITSAVQADASGWTVTDGDRIVRVERSGGLPWSVSRTGGDGVSSSGCAVASPGVATGSGGGGAPGASSAPVAPPLTCAPPTTVPGLPSQNQAEQTARSVLQRAGFDLSGSTVTSSGGSSEWTVIVTRPMGGAPLMKSPSSVTVGALGAIDFATGYLADAVAAGDYPLVDVTTAVQRLREGGRWVLREGPGPQPMMGAAVGASGGGVANGAPGGVSDGAAGGVAVGSPGPPVGGAPDAVPGGVPTVTATVPPSTMVCPVGAMCATPAPAPCPPGAACTAPPEPPATIRIVTGVQLGLAWAWPADATSDTWLLPVYVFETDGGMTVPVLALTDGYLSAPSTTTVPSVGSIPGTAPVPQPRPNLPSSTNTSASPS